jgi:hypothetical protein
LNILAIPHVFCDVSGASGGVIGGVSVCFFFLWPFINYIAIKSF